MTAEHDRCVRPGNRRPWKKWGPYLSERQWGTVREDYSEGGDAWDYFSHDQARSRAYRWGEDGLAGISDDQQRLCFALALWNGKDPILKERLFGLTNSESNHGEDVKEYYFYLDSTPTHSYMKYLYKYPQAAFPYGDLVETSRGRSRNEFEYELLDTGVFDEDRYFDVFVEYAKASPEDILIQITRSQPRARGGRAARPADALVPQPVVLARRLPNGRSCSRSPACRRSVVKASDTEAGRTLPLLRRRRAAAVHRERDQHAAHLRRPQPQPVRQGRHQQLRRPRPEGRGEPGAKRDQGRGPLSADREAGRMPGDSAAADRRAPADCAATAATSLRRDFDDVLQARRKEADEFYAAVIPPFAQRRPGQRHAAGAGRHAVEQAVLPLRRGQVARRARLRSVQGDAQAGARATTTGTTCTTATSSPCRTSGSIPGTRPGTWPSTCSP